MPFYRKMSEVFERIGAGTADFVDNVAEKIKEFSCELWNNYPDMITQGKFPATSFARGFMGSVCASSPPLPPTPPGCDGVYWVYGTFYSKNISAYGCNVEGYWRNNEQIPESKYLGPDPTHDNGPWYIPTVGHNDRVVPLFKSEYDSRTKDKGLGSRYIQVADASAPCQNRTQPAYGANLVVTDVVYVPSGHPDCIEARKYPQTTINSNDYSRTYNIENNGVTTEVTIEVQRDENDKITFPINFLVNNSITAVLDVGGIYFSGDEAGEDTVNNEDKPFKKTDYVAEEKEPIGVSQPEEEDEEVDESISYVQIDVVTPPDSGRTFVNSSASNVQYVNAGYFNWLMATDSGTYRMEDIRITRNKHIFKSPPEATGYVAYPVNGATIKTTTYKKK